MARRGYRGTKAVQIKGKDWAAGGSKAADNPAYALVHTANSRGTAPIDQGVYKRRATKSLGGGGQNFARRKRAIKKARGGY